MKTTTVSLPIGLCATALLLASAAFSPVRAQEAPEPPAAPAIEAAEAPTETEMELERDDATASEVEASDDDYRIQNAEIVRIHENAHLAKDESANALVAIFGSATSEGRVRESVVAIFGDARVTGPVAQEVVAVFGDAYVDSKVGDKVSAVFGNLELGPNAVINGDAVVFAGNLTRHPDAVVHGNISETPFAGEFGQLKWLRPWVEKCLLLGRPLALDASLEWAWWLAFGALALYVLISLLFSGAVEKCVTTFEQRPGETVIASLVTLFLSPIFMILLAITVIGAVFVPFFMIALMAAGLFGKAVVLATLGRRITRFADSGPFTHIAVATLIGGLLVMGLYLIPALGFILFMLFGILSVGVVAYTLLLATRARGARNEPTPTGAASASAAFAPAMAEDAETAYVSDTSGTATAGAPSETAAPPLPLEALPRADFWVRMGALAIDAILIAVIANLIPGTDDIWLVSLAIYGAIMWKLKGTTVGGIICNLRVVRVDGREVDWPTAIVRALGCFLSLVAVGLGFIWIAIDRDRQGWHDKIAGTLVVRTPKGTPLV
jgi:uncharacterized RDD family membrane protein YckC